LLDGERPGSDGPHPVRDVPRRVVGELEPAELDLDGDLPRAGGRHEELVARVLEDAELPTETLGLGEQPQEDLHRPRKAPAGPATR